MRPARRKLVAAHLAIVIGIERLQACLRRREFRSREHAVAVAIHTLEAALQHLVAPRFGKVGKFTGGQTTVFVRVEACKQCLLQFFAARSAGLTGSIRAGVVIIAWGQRILEWRWWHACVAVWHWSVRALPVHTECVHAAVTPAMPEPHGSRGSKFCQADVLVVVAVDPIEDFSGMPRGFFQVDLPMPAARLMWMWMWMWMRELRLLRPIRRVSGQACCGEQRRASQQKRGDQDGTVVHGKSLVCACVDLIRAWAEYPSLLFGCIRRTVRHSANAVVALALRCVHGDLVAGCLAHQCAGNG